MNLLYSTGVLPVEGFTTLFAFFAVGFFIAYRHRSNIDLWTIAQYSGALTLVRFAQSYMVYHAPLREGLWVLAWATAGIVGLAIGRASK